MGTFLFIAAAVALYTSSKGDDRRSRRHRRDDYCEKLYSDGAWFHDHGYNV